MWEHLQTMSQNISQKNNKLTHRLTKENVEEMFIRQIESDLRKGCRQWNHRKNNGEFISKKQIRKLEQVYNIWLLACFY